MRIFLAHLRLWWINRQIANSIKVSHHIKASINHHLDALQSELDYENRLWIKLSDAERTLYGQSV